MVEFIIQVLTDFIIPLLIKTAIIWVPVVCFTIGKKIWLDILEKGVVESKDFRIAVKEKLLANLN